MTRTLLIGLDGATFKILDDLVEDKPGRGVIMPFVKKIMDGGFRAPLLSTPHPLTPPAWTTLMTGKNPGEHGIFDFMRLEDKGRDVFFILNNFLDIRAETLWSMASRQGKRVAALNFPMMAPPPSVPGWFIPGFTSWRHLKRNSSPKGLLDELQGALSHIKLKELAWDFERENEIGQEMDEGYLSRWIQYHFPREEHWREVSAYILSKEKPDLMAVMFDGTDKIQHQAWRYIDPDLEPEKPSSEFSRLRNLCLTYFRRLDGYIRQLVESAGPDVRVFLASDHGFTATTEVVRINRYLSEKGYLAFREVASDEASKRRANSPFAYLDWSRTQAYCPTPSSNGIYIRIARSPGEPGIPPSDYIPFRRRLMEDLASLRDERGNPVIAQILLKEEAFAGQAQDHAPDLTLVLRDHGFVSIRDLSPVVVRRSYPAGTHHPQGIFIAWGRGIQPGAKGDVFPIADVASTLLHSVGLPVPEDLEGQVAPCFSKDFMADHPVKRGAPTQMPGERAASIPTKEDKQKILDQLAMLGYLED